MLELGEKKVFGLLCLYKLCDIILCNWTVCYLVLQRGF